MSKFYSNRAGAYMKLMDFNRAQKDCEECLKLNPGFVKAWIRKGGVQEAMKQHDNAMESYQVRYLAFYTFLGSETFTVDSSHCRASTVKISKKSKN